MEQEKKIGLPEAILMVMIVGGADLLEVITDLVSPIPVVGQALIFLNWPIDISVLAITQLWFIIKGGILFRKQVISLVGNLVEFIPLLDALPIRTVTLLIAIYLINHPKVMEVVSVAKGKILKPTEEITK